MLFDNAFERMMAVLYNFSVTPLLEDHFEERCKDIVDLVKTNVITMPLFSMMLFPEGIPVSDKVTDRVKLYAKYRDELELHGVKCGILVQASMGHDRKSIPNPFQKYVNLIDGRETNICCPEDENFVKHFCDVLKKLAKERPEAIMLDDDIRLMVRPGRGCVCPLHMKKFNDRTGLNMTKEQLYEYISTHDENDPVTDIFRDIQTNSLVDLVSAFRKAIDSVDPSIQGINCTSGYVCDSVMYTNKVFAGKGNPTMVRVPDGNYAPFSVREFSNGMCKTAICSSKLKKAGIDIILSETDTIPFNRYAKSAAYLHADYSASILEGAVGAKHWLTRISAYEPGSGKAYRNVLAKNYGLYEKLSEYAKEIKWVGCAQAFSEQEKFHFNCKDIWKPYDYAWTLKVLERIGIPFYFSENGGYAVFLEGDVVADMSDEQIEKVFEGSVFADGSSAKVLCDRGYGDRLGVTAEDWDLGLVSGECFDINNNICCSVQVDLRKLKVVADDVEVKSVNFVRKDNKIHTLAPAVTSYKRNDGRLSVTFCGSPNAPFNYGQGFSFLNESRKEQLVSLLKETGALPVYCYGDDEICLRAGYVNDGLLVAIFKLGIDIMDSIVLYLENTPKDICLLDGDGKEHSVDFVSCGDKLYEIKHRVETMYPLILIVKPKHIS